VEDGYDVEHLCLLVDVSGHLHFDGNRVEQPVNFALVETPQYLADLRFDGGHLALDFVNTLGGGHELGPQPHDEHLRGYRDLLAWSVRVGTLDEATAERLARSAGERGEHVLREAIELREWAYSVLWPIAEGRRARRAPADALAELREREREALSHARLVPGDGLYRWRWEGDDPRLPLWPLAHAAIEVLTEGPLDLLKVCSGCRWLFLDQSKNRSRRWCSMEVCGTSAKKRRYVERRRARALTDS
jgi:predicted RNA-binding Zn ribbon-like protein